MQAVVTLLFFSMRESTKWVGASEYSNSIPYSDTTWNSNHFCQETQSAPESRVAENSPLIACSCAARTGNYFYRFFFVFCQF